MSSFSPECAERLYGEISEAVCGFQARHLAANFQLHFRRERTALAFTRLFYLSRWGHDNNEDITRLLNLSDLDGSAFAEVISDYFDDHEASHDSSSEEDDFLDTGINSYTYTQKAGLIINSMYNLRKRQDIIEIVFKKQISMKL